MTSRPAQHLNCTNCGAALQPVGNRPYFRCGHCLTFHFPQETEDGVTVVGDPADSDCPVCDERLTHATIFGHPVGYCLKCRGFLATNRTFGRVVQLKRANQVPHPQVPLPFAADELRRRVKCPRCRKPMDTHPNHGGGNAVIDTCHRCQLVWLDAGELTVIGSYQGRTTPHGIPLPAPRATEPAEPEIDLFGFRIRLD
jgi:Zn-finger nucleic acid-binding protein